MKDDWPMIVEVVVRACWKPVLVVLVACALVKFIGS